MGKTPAEWFIIPGLGWSTMPGENRGVRGNSPAVTRLLYIVIVAAILIVMAVTNPGVEAFTNFIRHEFQREADLEPGLVRWLGSVIIDQYVKSAVYHRSYTFFSIYTLPVPGRDDLRFLGILGQFIPLRGVDRGR